MNRFIYLALGILFVSCHPTQKCTVDDLLEIDKQFSKASEKNGFARAFTDFAHTDAVILRDNNMPLQGKSAIAAYFAKADTVNTSFTWQPIDAEIAQSCDLGFTYGMYKFLKDSIREEGTYVSVWKKDSIGNWKYILDAGNEGL